MDLHKKTSSFCVLDKEGEVLIEKTIRTDPDEIRKFIKSLGKRNNPNYIAIRALVISII